MKKLLFAAAVCTSVGATAQINLEKSYTTNYRMEVVNIDGEGYKYIGVDASTKKIMIYNPDHSVWKTINTSIPVNASVSGIPLCPTYASKQLFNTDNKIEFIVSYTVFTSPSEYKVQIYNEDGQVIKEFNDANYYTIQKVDNSWKLLIHKTNSVFYTDVYSLPGQYTGLKPIGEKTTESDIYPNPMETAATLRYTLPSGTQHANINIYTSNGALARQMQVTNQFNEVLIQRGDLPAGNYYYQVTAPGVQPVSQQFVIR